MLHILASLTPDGQATVLAGLIASTAGVVVALISNRRQNKRVETRLGDPNGYNSVVEMVAAVLAEQTRQARKLDGLDVRLRDTEGTLAAIGRKVEIWGRTVAGREGAPAARGDRGSVAG